MQSQSLKSLLPALARAISDMPNPQKNKKNDHFKNRYADLGEVLDCVSGPLEAHGLLLTQTVNADMLITTVWHCESGECIDSCIRLSPEKNTPQGFASAMTYARRYAIKALFCMADDDDDGNNASRPKPAPAAAPKPVPKSETPTVVPFEFAEDAVQAIERCSTSEQLTTVSNRLKASGFSGEDRALCATAYKDRRQAIEEGK